MPISLDGHVVPVSLWERHALFVAGFGPLLFVPVVLVTTVVWVRQARRKLRTGTAPPGTRQLS